MREAPAGPWPPRVKYFASLVGIVVLFMNVAMLLRSARVVLYFLLSLWQEDPDSSPVQRVGLFSIATRQVIICSFELIGLLRLALQLVGALAQACRSEDAGFEGCSRWSATAQIFWEIVPALRSFSAMNVLRRVHPQLLPVQLSFVLRAIRHLRPARRLLVLSLFTLQRLVVLFFGFEAFLFKFTTTQQRLEANCNSPAMQVLVSIGFLNQVVGGVVQLELLMRRRLLLFLFGGEDAYIDPEEAAVMQVWLACLARALHRRVFHPERDGPGAGGAGERRGAARRHLRFLVAMLGFDHMELQRLVLWEDAATRDERRKLLRQIWTAGGQAERARGGSGAPRGSAGRGQDAEGVRALSPGSVGDLEDLEDLVRRPWHSTTQYRLM